MKAPLANNTIMLPEGICNQLVIEVADGLKNSAINIAKFVTKFTTALIKIAVLSQLNI